MSQHKKHFESLKILERLETAKKVWLKMPLENLQPQHKEDFERVLKVFLHLESCLKVIDVELYPLQIWQNVANYIDQVNSNGQQFAQSQNFEYIRRANSEIDNVLSNIHVQGKFPLADYSSALAESIGQISGAVVFHLTELAGKRHELETYVADFTKRINSLESKSTTTDQRLDTVVSEHQTQFSNAQDKRQSDFTTKQTERNDVFTKYMENIKNTFDNKHKENNDNFQGSLKQFSNDASKTLNDMQETQRKTETIYGIVGKDSVVGSHKVHADKAKKFAHGLFFGAIALMILVSIVVVFPMLSVFIDTTKTLNDINWLVIVCRIPIAGVLLLPAFYLANESKKQREKENRYRELEIKMATISPFFLEVGDQKATELPEKEKTKIELAKKLLSPIEEKEDKNIIIPPDVLEMLRIFASIKIK